LETEPISNGTRRRGLGQQAYLSLRDAIISGELQPDEPLSEVALAQRLKISRTPVREALTRLVDDGLVRNLPGRGSRVSGISLTDVAEIFQLREVLEGLAARLAAQNVRSDTGAIDDLIQQFSHYEDTGGNPSFSDYYRLTATLDATLVSMAGNKRLEESLRDLWAHSRRLRQYASHDVGRLEASATEHVGILEAVRAGEADKAELEVKRHLQNSRKALVAKVMGG
jgi:DNA-binding GntR family transcriptional regulator